MEILDDPFENVVEPKKIFTSILRLVLFGVVALLIIDALRPFIPIIKIPNSEIEISIVGILIFGVLLGTTSYLTKYLNQIFANWFELKIAASVGIVIFIVEFIFKTIQYFLYLPHDYEFELLRFLRISLIVGIICFLFSNYKIRKIREMETSTSILLFFGFFFAFGMLISKLGLV